VRPHRGRSGARPSRRGGRARGADRRAPAARAPARPAHARAYRSGRQADALGRIQDARRALVDQLGIEPGASCASSSRPSCARTHASTGPTVAARRGARAARLRRRERELAALDARLDARAGRDGGRLSSSGGEPGIGKSRLAEELTWRGQASAAREVCVGRCWEAGRAPAYWPWVQALRAYLRGARWRCAANPAQRDAAELARSSPSSGN
jgi:hypothetical protein